MLDIVKWARFRVGLRAQEELHLPGYKGSTFRGAFGNALRRVVCALRRDTCEGCLVREQCVYAYVFDTPVPQDSERMRKYPYAPHPFVIEPPEERDRVYAPGETLTFGLVLMGRAIDYLPYFVYTFDRMGETGIGRGRGKFRLEEAYAVGEDSDVRRVYDGESQSLSGDYPRLSASALEPVKPADGEVQLRFTTPTRIKYQGRLTLELTFEILVRNLLRRISSLAYFHCGGELDLDYRDMIERAKAVELVHRNLVWYDWERYSARQDERMKLGGFTGRIVFRGDLDGFGPLLRVGEHLHIGKGTSFGLGRYRIA